MVSFEPIIFRADRVNAKRVGLCMFLTLNTQSVFTCAEGDGAGAMARGRRQGWDALMCSRIGFDP